MTQIRTFSSAVDDVIVRSGRGDRLNDIISYLRSTVLECCVLRFFRHDLVEDQIVADSDNFVWTYPKNYRILRTARYPFTDRQNKRIYPPEIKPGKKQTLYDYFYYSAHNYIVFSGVISGSTIDLAYYTKLRSLPYYVEELRPAYYDLLLDLWVYKTAITDADKIIAEELVSNWLLFDYYDVIIEGGLAKLYKAVDDPRQRSTFALYKSFQNTLIQTEPSDSLGK